MTHVNLDSCYIREKFAETYLKGRDHDCSGNGINHHWRHVWSPGSWDSTRGYAGHGDCAPLRCRPLADPLPVPVCTNRRALPDDSGGLSLAFICLPAGGNSPSQGTSASAASGQGR